MGRGRGAVSLRGKVSTDSVPRETLNGLRQPSGDLQTRCSKNRGYPIVPPTQSTFLPLWEGNFEYSLSRQHCTSSFELYFQ